MLEWNQDEHTLYMLYDGASQKDKKYFWLPIQGDFNSIKGHIGQQWKEKYYTDYLVNNRHTNKVDNI